MDTKGRSIRFIIGVIILMSVFLSGLLFFNERDKAISDGNINVTPVSSRTAKKYICTVDEEKELPAQDKGKISVDGFDADVIIYTHSQNSVKAHFYGEVKTGNKDRIPYLEMEENGKTLIVRVKYPKNITFSYFYSSELQLDVTIPEAWLNDLNISTVSGDISAQNLSGADVSLKSNSGDIKAGNVTGKYITVETTSGDIDVANFNGDKGKIKFTSGDLQIGEAVISDEFEADTVTGNCLIDRLECKKAKLDSNSGNIEVYDMKTGSLKAVSTSGEITVKMRNGSAELKTTSGDISAEFGESFDSVKANSVSGSVTLTLPEDSEFSLDAKTITGRITCSDFPVKITSSGDKKLEGTVGNGHSKIEASTNSGNVFIRK